MWQFSCMFFELHTSFKLLIVPYGTILAHNLEIVGHGASQKNRTCAARIGPVPRSRDHLSCQIKSVKQCALLQIVAAGCMRGTEKNLRK